jgi:nucleoside-diphosphate-sugar epimerase
MKILILGANGFIGSHLCDAILAAKNWEVTALDMAQDKLTAAMTHKRFHFLQGDMLQEKNWIREQLQQCDVVLPLVAIATPLTYVQNPLRVFELDFEANLEIIRLCVEYKKRIIFPSTSEVYGMCSDAAFDEEESHLVTGPIHKERWIYSTSKQLLDRVIYAYGKHHQLQYCLFRPFNWYGPGLDNIFNPKQGGSRVLTQFIGNILRGEDILLVAGGAQKRCFMHIEDGIRALLTIIENENGNSAQKIFNLGNPAESISIRTLAQMLVALIKTYPEYTQAAAKSKLVDVTADEYYGSGYQDVELRVPAIERAAQHLGWQPEINLQTGLKKTLDFYLLRSSEEIQREHLVPASS